MANIIILINLVIFISDLVTADPCGDWTSYRDEKCFKGFDTLTPFSGAAQVCHKEGATIGIIRSAEEQGLVVANLKNQSIVDNVWLGIKKNGKTFLSLDGNALKYTNWANGRPHNQTDVDCVELSVDDENKWIDVKCEKKNAVICEKGQQGNNAKIENVLQQIRNNSERMDSIERTTKKELDSLKQNQTKSLNLIDAQRKEIDQLKQNQTSSLGLINIQRKELDNLKQNPVPVEKNSIPIGFIYIQLSGQSEPHTLWPQTEWNNISPNYSGSFFRAEGGKAAGFGQTQSEQSRSLEIKNGDYRKLGQINGFPFNEFDTNPYTVNNNFYKRGIFTGSYASGPAFAFNLRYTTEENRPSNQAIRIWIRIK